MKHEDAGRSYVWRLWHSEVRIVMQLAENERYAMRERQRAAMGGGPPAMRGLGR